MLRPQRVLCCVPYRTVPRGCPQSNTPHLLQPPHFLLGVTAFLFPWSGFSCMWIPLKFLSWPVSYLAAFPSTAFQMASLCVCPSSGLLLSSAFTSLCFFHGPFPSSSVTSQCSLLYPSLLPIHLFLSSPQQFYSHTTALIPGLPSNFEKTSHIQPIFACSLYR